MADIFSPDQRVATRKKVYDDFLNVDPMTETQQKAERGETKRQAMAAVGRMGQQAQSPQLQGLGSLGIITQAAPKQQEQLGQQAAQRDAIAQTGASMQQQIAGAKGEQSVQNVARGLESNTQKLARAVADRAFSEGMEAKQLIFHENSAIADYSLEKLAEDFEAGRVSSRELQAMQYEIEYRAVQRKYNADQALTKAMAEFQTDLNRGNIENAKRRIKEVYAEYQAALKDAVRAKSIGSLFGGVTQAVSAAGAGTQVLSSMG